MKTFTFTAIVCSLFAATTVSAFEAGTYTAQAQGQNAPIKLSVTFTNDKIAKIEIVDQKETVGIGSAAAPIMVDRILKDQSLNVDAVAGATATSNAVKKAVEECIVQAKGNVADMNNKAKKEVAAMSETLNTDLLVIGGGGAGMISAINAADQGLKVILLEKMNFLGGASGICAGGMLIEGSKLQKELGVTDDTPEKFIADMLANGQNLNNKPTLKTYAENVGPTVDWLVGKGVKLRTENGVEKRAEFKTPRLLLLKGGCPGYAQTLRDLLAKSGAEVLLGTRAEELLMKDGKVVGATAKKGNTTYTINAKAVILATGGYGANRDMLEGSLKNTLYYGPVSSTGDGHKMAIKAGAQMQLMPYAKIYYNGLEVAPGIAKSTLTGNALALSQGAIMVDKNGSRVVDEKGTGRSIVTAQSKAGGILYLVMDGKTFEMFRNGIKNNGVSPVEVDKWLAENGKGTPLFAHGQTLEEAAKNAGINGENLVKTVKQFNEFVAKGKDEAFGRKADNMKSPISDKGPYYIVEQKPRFATTMGSVVLTDKMEVKDKNGNVIPGLYAAGEVANSVHGDDSAPAANVAWVATSAKLASQAVADQIKK